MLFSRYLVDGKNILRPQQLPGQQQGRKCPHSIPLREREKEGGIRSVRESEGERESVSVREKERGRVGVYEGKSMCECKRERKRERGRHRQINSCVHINNHQCQYIRTYL